MRKILLALTFALTLSGLPIAYAWIASAHGGWEKAIVLAHIWGGVFFIVVFPLYAWDHIGTNKHWLKRFASVTVSGLSQLAVGILLVLSGVLLLLYGDQVWLALRAFHHWITYLLIVALVSHYFSPKRWR